MAIIYINWGTDGVTSHDSGGSYVALRTATGVMLDRRYESAFRSMEFNTENILPVGCIPTKIKISATYHTNVVGAGFRISRYGSGVSNYIHNYSGSIEDINITEEDAASLYRISGNNYGVSFWLYNTADFGRRLYLSNVSVGIEYEDVSKVFLGETPVTKAYLGNTTLTGIYLGDTKLL